MSEIEEEAALQQINNELFERLERYNRAIANWKKLQIVIVVLRLCHGRVDNNRKTKKKTYKELAPKPSWDDWFVKFVIKPTSRYMIVWNAFMTLVYIASIFTDSLLIAFHLTPLLEPDISNWSTISSVLMLLDIIIKFFVAFKANQTELALEDVAADEKVEKTSQTRHRAYVE